MKYRSGDFVHPSTGNGGGGAGAVASASLFALQLLCCVVSNYFVSFVQGTALPLNGTSAVSRMTSTAPTTCTYDYQIVQRIGKNTYDGLPLKILRQSGNTVGFTVGNSFNEELIDGMYVLSNDVTNDKDGKGSKVCYGSSQIEKRKSIGTSLQAYCSKAKIATVSLFVSDSSFDASSGDDAVIPDDCQIEDSSGGVVEFMAILQCEPTCTENEVPTIDPFELNFDDDGDDRVSVPLDCPTDDQPVIITTWNDGDVAQLRSSAPTNVLCTLIEMNVNLGSTNNGELLYSAQTYDPDQYWNLKPIARTYNGNPWEISPGSFSSYRIDCSDDGCGLPLPSPPEGRYYVLKAYYDYATENGNLNDDHIKARFLERNTFGPTKSTIGSFTSPEEWLREQLDEEISSHRRFFRERATNWFSYTSRLGLLSSANGPCSTEARYRRYAMLQTDEGSYLEIQISPINSNKLILSVGGEIRSIVDGPLQIVKDDNVITDVDMVPEKLYSYEVTGRTIEGVGGRVTLKGINGSNKSRAIQFNGVYGNPLVQLDDDHIGSLSNAGFKIRVLDIPNQKKTNVMQQYFFREGETDMIQVIDDFNNEMCRELKNGVVQGFGYPPRSVIGRTGKSSNNPKYWIYSPTFHLYNNDVDEPMLDGGKAAVDLTSDLSLLDNITALTTKEKQKLSVKCSNVYRSFLNEDSCRLSNLTNVCSYDKKADIRSDSGQILICGSPNEVGTINDVNSGPLGKNGFEVKVGFNETSGNRDKTEQRNIVWASIALWGKDQLRQKMSYALSQMIVVSPNLGDKELSESYINYYDIFVRNAFGNYFNILKEVTLNPMMGYMLTYSKGTSSGYAFVNDNIDQQADENYAREIMQLFTFGLALRNDDGTLILDEDGNEIQTYTNFDISEYAKVYVGLDEQKVRGNVEGNHWSNQIDPLQVNAKTKDYFPKLGINNTFVGDGYPLCSDIPVKHFLKKGATYIILGAKSNPDLVNEPEWWHGSADPKRVSIVGSALADALSSGKNKIVLTEDVSCTGIECQIFEPRTVEVEPGLWYEYVRPKCVNHVFYNDPKSMYNLRPNEFKQIQCGNPDLLDGSTNCNLPSGRKVNSRRDELFAGERVPFNEASRRCSSDFPNTIPRLGNSCNQELEGACDGQNVFYWLNSPCTISVKINSEGSVAVVHSPDVIDKTPEDTFRYVSVNTVSYFRAHWISDIEKLLSNFDLECLDHGCSIDESDDTCHCEVNVENTAAFDIESDLLSVENVLSVVTIGAFTPSEDIAFISTGISGVRKSSSALDSNTIFEIIDDIGRTHYRKNIKDIAILGDGRLRMRNPVTFWSLSGYARRDGENELHAALEHYFYHPNTPQFVGTRLAKHFGNSNPSPRYIKVIATAFKTGNYNDFGTNSYGCLEATIAAIVLDRESVDHILDLDPASGQMPGPYLRFIKLLRALEYATDEDNPLPRFKTDIEDEIGEEPFKQPTVFSFFQPEYISSGRSGVAGLYAPELQILNGPTSISSSNGYTSVIKYGSSSCYGSFFNTKKGLADGSALNVCSIGDDSSNFGNNKYLPGDHELDPNSADQVVADLSLLLTSGRLTVENEQIVKDAFVQTLADGKSTYEALVNAQQLIVLTPEFNTATVARKLPELRPSPGVPEPTGFEYKAIVHLMLSGGLDSFNVLVPKSCSGTNSEGTPVHLQYKEVRGDLAFANDEFDLTITPNTDQPCEEFAIHEELPYIKKLYDEGDLLFFANVGVVNKNGMDRHNWDAKTKSRLFSHNSMEEDLKLSDPFDQKVGTGWLGRLGDLAKVKFGSVFNAFGIQKDSILLSGDPQYSSDKAVVNRNGPALFGKTPKSERYFDIDSYAAELNSKHDPFSSVFAESWSDVFSTGIESNKLLDVQFQSDSVKLDKSIWVETDDEDKVNKSFETLAKTIQTRVERKVDRDAFTLDYGGFDQHKNMKEDLKSKLFVVNKNIQRLVEQLKKDGIFDSTTIIVASEFGRTLTKNSQDGSDHGWAGNYFVIGGGINGTRVMGKYPDDLRSQSRLNASRNSRVRFIPTMSWEAILNGVSEWFIDGLTTDDSGLTESDLDEVLPNRANGINPVKDEGNFPLLKKEDLYLYE